METPACEEKSKGMEQVSKKEIAQVVKNLEDVGSNDGECGIE